MFFEEKLKNAAKSELFACMEPVVIIIGPVHESAHEYTEVFAVVDLVLRAPL